MDFSRYDVKKIDWGKKVRFLTYSSISPNAKI